MDHEDGDGDGAGLGGGVDGDSGRGMEKTSGGDSGGVSPPPIFSGSSLLSLCFWFRVSPPPLPGKHRGTIFYRRFYVTRKLQGEGSTQTGPRGLK